MVRNVTGFLIDMDGVIYRGSKPIRGSVHFIARLQQLGTPFLFLTNNSQRSRRDVCLRLDRMGIRIEEQQVFINNGARLVATNLDPHCPTETGSRPGCGAIVSLLETATGRKALGIGKPSPITMQEAARELGTDPEHTVMVGDTMETDILGGVQLGFKTVLVLSGGSKRSDLVKFAYRPTYVVNSIKDLAEHELLRALPAPAQERRMA